MDRGTRVFWAIFAALVTASIYFAVQTRRLRREFASETATIQTGDLAALASVTDGDTVVVKNSAGAEVVVRILGIKALGGSGKDPLAVYGAGALETLRRILEDKPIRVLLGSPPKDKHGRTLATLYVEDSDVGLRLVSEGAALVYTAFPFPAMQRYLEEQSKARAERKGLWGNDAAAAHADLLLAVWRSEAN